jgi:hypothetical protein
MVNFLASSVNLFILSFRSRVSRSPLVRMASMSASAQHTQQDVRCTCK